VASPLDEIVKVPAAVEVYPYAPQPAGGAGVEAMKGPAVCPKLFVATAFKAARPPGSVPMWAEYMLTAEASVRASACAFAIRARAWMFA
jgi:hypothetical protein